MTYNRSDLDRADQLAEYQKGRDAMYMAGGVFFGILFFMIAAGLAVQVFGG